MVFAMSWTERLEALKVAEREVKGFKIYECLRLTRTDLEDELTDFVFHYDTRKNTMSALWWGAGSLIAYTGLIWLLAREFAIWPLWVFILVVVAAFLTLRWIHLRAPRKQGSPEETSMITASGEGKLPPRVTEPGVAARIKRQLDVAAVLGTLAAAGAIRHFTATDDVGGRGIAFLVLMAFIGGVRIPGRRATFAIGMGLVLLHGATDWSNFGPDSGAQVALSRAWAAGVAALVVGVGVTCQVSYRRKKALSLLWVRGQKFEAMLRAKESAEAEKRAAEAAKEAETAKLRETIRAFNQEILVKFEHHFGHDDHARATAFHQDVLASVQDIVPGAAELIDEVTSST